MSANVCSYTSVTDVKMIYSTLEPMSASALVSWLGETELMQRRRAAINTHLPSNAGLQQAASPEQLEGGQQPGTGGPSNPRPKARSRRRLPYHEWVKQKGQQQAQKGGGGQQGQGGASTAPNPKG